MSNNRFYCKLYSAVHEDDNFECTYHVIDIGSRGGITLEGDIRSHFRGTLEVYGKFEHYKDIPSTGTYEEILKHFDLWEEKN